MKKPETIYKHLIQAVKSNPDYQVLERIKLGELKLPHHFTVESDDDVPVVILDLETTGFDAEKEGITEVGLVRITYNPETNTIVSITDAVSLYNDPGIEIPEIVIAKTGITNEMIKGTSVSTQDIAQYFEDDPLVIAHNAGFDRKFFDKKFPELANLRWACSRDGTNWTEMGFDSTKLEYINFKAGFFYDGHRAEVDCFALINMLLEYPSAMYDIYDSSFSDLTNVHMVGIPFQSKDVVKDMGARWDGDFHPQYGKHWWFKELTDVQVEKTIAEVSSKLPGTKFHTIVFDARLKFK